MALKLPQMLCEGIAFRHLGPYKEDVRLRLRGLGVGDVIICVRWWICRWFVSSSQGKSFIPCIARVASALVVGGSPWNEHLETNTWSPCNLCWSLFMPFFSSLQGASIQSPNLQMRVSHPTLLPPPTASPMAASISQVSIIFPIPDWHNAQLSSSAQGLFVSWPNLALTNKKCWLSR